jgi:hemerythrin-like domain-containing protein
MAKKTTRKRQGKSRRGAKSRAGGRRRKVGVKTRAGKTRRAPQSRTARRKSAARAAATRSTRREKAPRPASRLKSTAATVRGVVAGAVAAVSQRLPFGERTPDAITLLETEHRYMEKLFRQGEETTERAVKGRTDLLETLTSVLNEHELIEENVLYPALKAHPEARDIVLEGYQEHHVADVLVRELHQVSADDEQWGAKFKVLKESIEHHIKEEERGMFPTARGVLSREELQALGARMLEMKERPLPRRE